MESSYILKCIKRYHQYLWETLKVCGTNAMDQIMGGFFLFFMNKNYIMFQDIIDNV